MSAQCRADVTQNCPQSAGHVTDELADQHVAATVTIAILFINGAHVTLSLMSSRLGKQMQFC